MKNNSFLLLCTFAISLMTLFSCGDTVAELPDPNAVTIWTGPNTTFVKANGADPTDPANQDQLTANVAITRGNTGGEIFNIAIENSSTQNISPMGTQWAVGDISNIDNLDFTSFRQAVGRPQDVVGQNLVLFLVEDEIFLSVTFTQWTSGTTNGGGFAYERSTP